MDISQLYQLFLRHPVVTTDTRSCPPGALFFALRGATFDGNRFALQALEKGCAYAVVDEDIAAPGDERILRVADSLRTLQNLAHYHREQLGTPVLQITGTNGKTTTKELTAAVLAQKYRVLSTQGNLNNHIGVPKTLLRLTRAEEIAVVETGANHPGEIRTLAAIADPDCGLITNVGRAHLEGFGSFEGVVRTKGELYDRLRAATPSGRLAGAPFIFLNGDDRILSEIAHDLSAFTYGRPGGGYDVEGEVLSCAPFLRLRWRPRGEAWREVQTRLVGAYNLANVLAAAAVGTRFGVSPQQVDDALQQYRPTNNRSELLQTQRNTLIVDAYNANPTSMAAALDNFRLIPHEHKMAILGGMRELGAASAEEHAKVVSQLDALGLEEAWLVGPEFRPFAATHLWFPDVEAVAAALQAEPPGGRLILIKGSNGQRLFLLPQYL